MTCPAQFTSPRPVQCFNMWPRSRRRALAVVARPMATPRRCFNNGQEQRRPWRPIWLPLVLALACLVASESRQDEVQSTTNQNININNQQETIKSGNTKVNNYNLQESNYQPTQSTQLVFNVGKQKSDKLRRSRPPTVDEFELKKRIMELYFESNDDFRAGQRASHNFDHLGRVLRALNPKYIATRRVALVAFADPRDPDAGRPAPESELPPPTITSEDEDDLTRSGAQGEDPLVLNGESELSLQQQLDLLAERVKQIAVWDRDFVRKLFQVPDGEFTPTQLAYKRLLQCMSHPMFCKQQQMVIKKQKAPLTEEPLEDLLAAAPAAAVPAVSQAAKTELEEPDMMPEASEPEPTIAVYPRGSAYGEYGQTRPNEQLIPNEQVYRPQQQQQQHWRYQQQPQQQQPPPLPMLVPQAQPQMQQQQRWPGKTGAPPARRFRTDQQVNYQAANPDVNLPQKLIQQYAPEYGDQMKRMNKIRGGAYRQHK